MKTIVCVAAMLAVTAGSPALAKKKVQTGTPAQVQKILGCRSIEDQAQRLACFDREAAAVQQAISAKDLVFIDRQKATATKRELFGFSLPDFGGLFGDDDEDPIKQIESTVATAGRNADGGWIIRLADKSLWTQTDDTVLGLMPKPGQKVVVRRAALGNFRMSIEGQPGLKVKRIG